MTTTTTRTLDATVTHRPAKLAHFVLRTNHFDEAVAWYGTVVGARAVFANKFLAFLTYDDEHHRIALVNTPDAPDQTPGAPGLEHVAFTFAELGELLATFRRLTDEGITPAWSVNHGPTTSIYYADPDGNQVELQVDNFADNDALMAWFKSGDFARNPIGTPFDPESLAQRFEAGEPVTELLTPPVAD